MFGMIRLISVITRLCSTASSRRMEVNCSVSRSRSSLVTRLSSRNSTAGVRSALAAALHFVPDLLEVGQVRDDVFFGSVGRPRCG